MQHVACYASDLRISWTHIMKFALSLNAMNNRTNTSVHHGFHCLLHVLLPWVIDNLFK